MKIRNGYVSNSSSSSFVVVGYLFNDQENKSAKELFKFINPEIKDFDEYIENRSNECSGNGLYCCIGNEDNGFSTGKTFVGVWHTNVGESGELDEKCEPLEEIVDKVSKVKHLVPEGEKIKLITASYCC